MKFVPFILKLWLLLPGALTAADSPEKLLDEGHVKRAKSVVDSLLKANANDARALWLQARINLAYGQPGDAMPLAQRAAAIDPKSAEYHATYADAICSTIESASVFRQPGLAKDCKKEADAALAINPKHLDALETQTQFYLQAPSLMGGDKTKAEANLKLLEQVEPSFAYQLRARLPLKDKDPEVWLTKAITANPASYTARIGLARHYLQPAQKKYDLAEKQAREAVRIDSSRGSGYAVLARAVALQGRVADLDGLLEQAARSAPDDRVAFYSAANGLLEIGKDLTRSEGWFLKYLTQEPEAGTPSLAVARWRLGLTLEKLGRRKEAAEQLQAAFKSAPANSQIKADWKRLQRP